MLASFCCGCCCLLFCDGDVLLDVRSDNVVRDVQLDIHEALMLVLDVAPSAVLILGVCQMCFGAFRCRALSQPLRTWSARKCSCFTCFIFPAGVAKL